MTVDRAGGPADNQDNQDNQDNGQNELDDAFRAVMEGLRTTLPGVQVLFAFLLTMPLQPGFAELDSLDRDVFYLAFASSALASVLLITPSVHQRIRAPISGLRRRTARHVFVAIRIANAGTVIAAVALSASVYLVTSLVFGDRAGAVAAGVLALVTAWAWFYLPLVAFRHR